MRRRKNRAKDGKYCDWRRGGGVGLSLRNTIGLRRHWVLLIGCRSDQSELTAWGARHSGKMSWRFWRQKKSYII